MSVPRVSIRRQLPWPLRWVAWALALGFSGAIAMWAFEFGKDIAGLDRGAKEELQRLRVEVAELRSERDKAQSIANTAESLLKAERTAQEKLGAQLRQLETDNLALKADLGFFERLLPTAATGEGPAVRGLQAELKAPGQMRYQLLVMQNGRNVAEFDGRYDLVLTGTLDNLPWAQGLPGGAKPLQLKQYMRIDGLLEHPPRAVVKTVQVRVMDKAGGVRATQSLKL
ncbi:hypothetical protein BurJ1DRAFT_1067 [Burkholderiales bacterium JOSHI_001]|nr:hypothetical protein BurJ1DRAFT_1067 [Burkholderiales bacterium JOSHI_001]